MFKALLKIALALLLFISIAFYAVFLSPRPALTTDPATLAGEGSLINYCELTQLDGAGLKAVDIPKGNTPGCMYEQFPLPILAKCTEPLAEGVPDLRGLWQSEDGHHVERLEQCGTRAVITTSGVIHDGGPNSTLGLTTNDTEGPVFQLFGKTFCPRTSARFEWSTNNEGKPVMNFRAFGWGPIVVKRYMEGEQLIWEYLNGSVTRMNRICTLPPEHKHSKRLERIPKLF